jgi:hypothetical protein
MNQQRRRRRFLSPRGSARRRAPSARNASRRNSRRTAQSEAPKNHVFNVADGILWLCQSVDRNSGVRKMQVA